MRSLLIGLVVKRLLSSRRRRLPGARHPSSGSDLQGRHSHELNVSVVRYGRCRRAEVTIATPERFCLARQTQSDLAACETSTYPVSPHLRAHQRRVGRVCRQWRRTTRVGSETVSFETLALRVMIQSRLECHGQGWVANRG